MNILSFFAKFSLISTVALGSLAMAAENHNSSRSNKLVSLADGTYRYNVFEAWPLSCGNEEVWNQSLRHQTESTCEGEATTILEIVDDGARNEQDEVILLSDLILEVMVNPELHRPPISLNQVENISALRGIDKKDIWRRTGLPTNGIKVIRDNQSGIARIINILKEKIARGGTDESGNVFLYLPDDFQRIVDDAQAKGNRVIIIIRLKIQENKKGLNAVNVKLA